VSSDAQNTGNRFVEVMGSLMTTIVCFTERLAFLELLFLPCTLASAGRRKRAAVIWRSGDSIKLHQHRHQAHPVLACRGTEIIFATSSDIGF